MPGPQPGKQKQQRRPGEIELLLDRQRPEMDERVAGGIRREIVERPADQPDIDHVGRRKQRAFGVEFLFGRRQDEVAGNQRHQDDEQRRRQQAPGAPGVEGPQVDGAACGDFLLQVPGDQISRDHEEDIDADEAARQPGRAEVEGNDAEHGERAQAFDIRAERSRCRDGAHLLVPDCWEPPTIRIGR